MTHHILLHGSLQPTNFEKNLKPCKGSERNIVNIVMYKGFHDVHFPKEVITLKKIILVTQNKEAKTYMLYTFANTCFFRVDKLSLN